MQITNRQLKLINKATKYIYELKKSKIDLTSSTYCYLTCWGESLGYSKLKFWNSGYKELFSFALVFIKNLYLISIYSTFGLHICPKYKKNYTKIIISWCSFENFGQDGSYNDRYFNVNSKNTPNTLWLLISLDDKLPNQVNDNIFVFKREKKSPNIFFLLKYVFGLFFEKKFSIRKVFHQLSFHSFLSTLILKETKKKITKYNFDKILMPYEAQPFQQVLFNHFKTTLAYVETVGYIHNMISPLPTEYFFRPGSPDKLIIHGENQSKILEKYFLWPKEKMILSQSFGFSLENIDYKANFIYLPYQMANFDLATNELSKFLKNSSLNNYEKLKVKIHPVNINSSKNIKLKKKVDSIITEFDDRFSENEFKEKISIVFGFSSLIMQSLEKGYKVIQITTSPVLEVFGNIWSDLEVKQISQYVYSYQLSKKSGYINFSKNNKYFNEYFAGY